MAEPIVVSRYPDGRPKVGFFSSPELFFSEVGSFYGNTPSDQGGYQVSAQSTPQPPRPSVTEGLAEIAKVKACPHWSKPGCGCQWGNCALGKGKDGVVTFDECRKCIEAGENVVVKTMSFDNGGLGKLHNLDSIGKGWDLSRFYQK